MAAGEIATLEPSHAKRAREQVRFQQFSTPRPLAHAALRAAALRPGDIVLEPSAGTEMLAVVAKCTLRTRAAGSLNLNETAPVLRTGLPDALFSGATVNRHNAEAEVAREPHIFAVEAHTSRCMVRLNSTLRHDVHRNNMVQPRTERRAEACVL